MKKEKTQKYPKKIEQIMRESPLAYAIVVLIDYDNGVGVDEIYKRWKIYKKKNKS